MVGEGEYVLDKPVDGHRLGGGVGMVRLSGPALLPVDDGVALLQSGTHAEILHVWEDRKSWVP